MTKSPTYLLISFVLAFTLTTNLKISDAASTTHRIQKREYKTMLNAASFAGDHLSLQLALKNLQNDLENIAARFTSNNQNSGSFVLKKGMPRAIKFYDSRGDCRLNQNGWVFRLRRRSNESDWEGTLKFRNGDRYFSGFRRKNMNECGERYNIGEKGKFEEDIDIHWQSKFSYSHKCSIPESKNINKLADIAAIWVEMGPTMKDMGWKKGNEIEVVSGLTVTEIVYTKFSVDFGNGDPDEVGEFSLTLWFAQPFSSSPDLAELSFTIGPRDDTNPSTFEEWNEDTIMRAHAFWEEVAKLSWIDPKSSSKTSWVYGYDPSFCSL